MRVAGLLLLVAAGVAGVVVVRGRTAAGQPPADYTPMNTRSLKLGIVYDPTKRAQVRQVQLFASRDQGQTWQYESFVTPDKEFFAFVAKDDGIHWFNMVTVFTDGSRDPVDVTRGGDPQKILVDATPPQASINRAAREGDDIAVEWAVEEKYPNDARTRVQYKTAADFEWKDVPLPDPARKVVRFNPNSNATVQVRVSVEDLVGNPYVVTREVAGVATSANPAPAPAPVTTSLKQPSVDLIVPTFAPTTAALPPPNLTAPPATPAGPPAPVINLAGDTTPKPVVPEMRPAAAPPAIATGAGTAPPAAIVTSTPPPPAAVPESPTAQLVNTGLFEFPVQIEAGPSGIRSIDLYLTKDDGRSWQKWHSYPGRETTLKVNVRPRPDLSPDGTYGFRLVATSGAGLGDDPPQSGNSPEFRVQVDTTPPVVTIFEPAADPANRDVLVLQWSVSDKNLGSEPVALEWSESATGPWRPVPSGGGVALAAGGQADVSAAKVPNTGRYPWKVPATLGGPGVYLRVTAWDAAGNRSEVSTGKPIQVDLVKPRARIQGVVPVSANR